MELGQGRVRLCVRKGSALRGWSCTGTGSQAMALSLPEIKYLDNACGHMVYLLVCPVWIQELDTMILLVGGIPSYGRGGGIR